MKSKYRFFICERCGKAALEIVGTLQEEMSLDRACAKRILELVDAQSTLGIGRPIRRKPEYEVDDD